MPREVDAENIQFRKDRSEANKKPVNAQMRAKLSEYYLENLSEHDISLAKFLIKTTVRVNMGVGIHPFFVADTKGKFWWNGRWYEVRPKGYSNITSIGEIICEAIKSKIINGWTGFNEVVNEYEPAGENENKLTLPVEELRYLIEKEQENESRRGKIEKVVRIARTIYNDAPFDYYNTNVGTNLNLIKQDILDPSRATREAKEAKEREERMSQAERERKEAQEKREEEARKEAERREAEERAALLRAEAEEREKKEREEKEYALFKDHPDAKWLAKRFTEIEEYLEQDDANQSDVLSNASWKNAGRMLKVGIDKEAILHAYALTWSDHVRAELEIQEYNVLDFGEPIPGQHGCVPYVEKLIEAEVLCMLVGPTQAGKGYLCRNVALNRSATFAEVPLSAGTSVAWLYGRNTPTGKVETKFIETFRDGGVFLFDEMDAADPNLLLAVNDALANNELFNPVLDQVIEKHDKFIPMAAANTWGLGADADYTGRERLDMATLERWRMGRVTVEYDRELQRKIFMDQIGID